MGPAESSQKPTSSSLQGELSPVPRPPWVTVLLAISGLLVIFHGMRLLARLVLSFRHTAEVRLNDAGVVIHTRSEILGRPLRERENLLPRSGLVRATREVRYPRLAMYAGLLALALGSYVGVGLVVDGVRAASASMFGMGAVIALVGLGLDFALSSLIPGSTGKCRMVLVPRRGRSFCIDGVVPADADRLLSELGSRSESPAPAPRKSLETLPGIGDTGRADHGSEEAKEDGAGHP